MAKQRRWGIGLAVLALMMVVGGVPVQAGPKPPPAAVHPAGPVGGLPAALPQTFWLGVASQPDGLDWMTGSGVPWNARYQYLAGGVNTGTGWSTWNTPAGAFARYYMDSSAGAHYLPVFTYYQLLQSSPGAGGSEPERDFSNLNNPATMAAYYADFQLLLTKVAAFGRPVLIHVEPDLWGYMQQRVVHSSNSAADVPASVASSGFGAVAAYPNTVQGFAQALLHLRDSIAPNALLAIHASDWGWGGADIGISTDPTLDATAVGSKAGAFLRTAGLVGNPAGTSSWDLVFTDLSDRDAAWYQLVAGDGGAHWWDLSNQTFPNFDRYRTYVAALNAATGRRIVLWQLPIGNTLMRSCDNTTGHYQDNRVQGLLGNNGAALPAWIAAGVVGLLWGAGEWDTTMNVDARGDGVTNPAPINGNTGQATVADDDGGYLRAQAAAYYSRGVLPLPGAACGVFLDVPADYWAYAPIHALACGGVVSGYSDGTFRPGSNTTRAQFAKMLVLGMGWTVTAPARPSFSDVPATLWSYAYVETARAHGAISGYSDGTFRPNSDITRAQLAKMIVTATGWSLLTPARPSFGDVPATHWAYSFVETAKAHAVIGGYSDGTFRPNNAATRAQLSKMLDTALSAP
jgi:hypothetical protein